jgi:uncharacterized protein (TIGR00369 family)
MVSAPNMDNSEAVLHREKPPYYYPLGLEIVATSEGFAKVKMPFSKDLLNVYESINGGIITTLADAATANALMTVYDDKMLLTIDAKINFLRPARSDLFCEAHVRHRGRQMAVCDAEVMDENGKAIAMGLFTYAIRQRPDNAGPSSK